MDLEIAEPDDATRVSRRGLVARAGLAGLAAAFVIDRSQIVGASAPDDRPNIPTDADTETLEKVIGVELAASDLYKAAQENAADDLAVAIGIMADNHRAYAEAAAGITGTSAQNRDDAIYDENEAGFTGSADDFFLSAHTLEQQLVATHSELIGDYESEDAIALTASIAVVEARHATVLADLAGVDDLDVLFGNDESALDLSGDEA